jgi:hypothetical protein
MNAVEIEQAISDLAEQPFNAREFPSSHRRIGAGSRGTGNRRTVEQMSECDGSNTYTVLTNLLRDECTD